MKSTLNTLFERFQQGYLSLVGTRIHTQIVRIGKTTIIHTDFKMGELCNVPRDISKSTVKAYMGSKVSFHFRRNDHLHCSRRVAIQIVLQLIQHRPFIQILFPVRQVVFLVC